MSDTPQVIVIETNGATAVTSDDLDTVELVDIATGIPGPEGPTGPAGPAGSDADVTAHEAKTDPHTQYVNTAGDTMTGALKVSPTTEPGNVQIGAVWDGSYTGIQQLPIGANVPTSGSAVLMGSAADSTALYLIGRAAVLIRPAGDYTKQWAWNSTNCVASSPLTLPANPTANLHATTKQYVDTRSPVSDPFESRGISALPSLWMMSFTAALTSGTVSGLFFVCNTNRPCNRLATLVTTVGAATPTVGRMGIYRVDATTRAMTLAVSTTNNANLLTTIGWRIENITGGDEVVGGVWTPTPGRMYCATALNVSAVTVASVASNATFHAYAYALGADIMPMTYALVGQTDLPTSPGIPTATHLNAALRSAVVVALYAP